MEAFSARRECIRCAGAEFTGRVGSGDKSSPERGCRDLEHVALPDIEIENMVGIDLIGERDAICRRNVAEMIRPCAPLHGVRSWTPYENIVAISPQQKVVPSQAGQNIVSIQSRDRVV